VGGSLVLGGALGNLLDRVLRGYVVDYVDFRFFPAFNLADAAVVVGAAAMAVAFLWGKE
ncbi:signal peptidase II, partial [Candidatus Bipolaricaulota bacterium]